MKPQLLTAMDWFYKRQGGPNSSTHPVCLGRSLALKNHNVWHSGAMHIEQSHACDEIFLPLAACYKDFCNLPKTIGSSAQLCPTLMPKSLRSFHKVWIFFFPNVSAQKFSTIWPSQIMEKKTQTSVGGVHGCTSQKRLGTKNLLWCLGVDTTQYPRLHRA